MRRSSLKTNYIYSILYQLLILVIPLVTSPYLTRTIGAKGLGTYTFIQAFASYFSLFVLLGVNNYGNREIAKCRDDKKVVSKVFWEIYMFQIAMLVVISGLYLIFVVLFVRENKLLYLIQYIYILSVGLDIGWCCFGLEMFRLTVIRNTIIKTASAILVFICVKKSGDLWIFAMISTVSALISQIVIWPFVLQEISFIKPDIRGILRHVKPNITLFLPVVAVSLYTIMDKIMIGMIDIKEEVAYYTYALKFIDIPQTAIVALGTVMLPHVSNMIATGREEETRVLMKKTMQYMMLFTVYAAFLISCESYDLVTWYYSASFERCALFAAWLSPYIVLGGWNGTIRNMFIIPKGLDYIYLLTVSCGAASNLILNAVLIPHYRGLGAVIATIISQAVVCFMQFILTRRYIDYKPILIDIMVFSLGGIVMIRVIKALPSLGNPLWNCILMAVVGLAVYLTIALSYLYIKKDRDLIDTILNRKNHEEY